MKLVGITGKSGAGKTTLSNILAQNENIGVVHVDDLVKRSKKLYNKRENTVKKKIRKIIYGNKYLFLLYIQLRARMVNPKIKKAIQEFEREGKKVTIIESVHLRYYPIFQKLNQRILIQRPYIKRQESVLLRDKDKNMDKETFLLWDMPYKKSYYKEKIEKYDKKIENGTLEGLEQVAKEIEQEMEQEVEQEITNVREKRQENFQKYKQDVKNIKYKTQISTRKGEASHENR